MDNNEALLFLLSFLFILLLLYRTKEAQIIVAKNIFQVENAPNKTKSTAKYL